MVIAIRNVLFWIFIDLNVQPKIQILIKVQYVKAVKTNERGDDFKCHQNTLSKLKNYKSLKSMGQSIIRIKTIHQFIHPTMKVNSYIITKPYYLPINRLHQISLHYKYKNFRVYRLFWDTQFRPKLKLKPFKTFKKI